MRQVSARSYGWKTRIHPVMGRIAADLQLSRSTVKRALADLEKQGYLEKTYRFRENGSYTSNLYTVLPRPPP